MKKNLIKVVVLAAVCALGLSGEVFAGQGGRNALKTHSATKVQTKTKLQSQIKTQSRQQLNMDNTNAAATSVGTGKASQRKLGLADGSELAPQPLDGTGFGSPAN